MELIDDRDLTMKNIPLKIQKITALIERLTKARDNELGRELQCQKKSKKLRFGEITIIINMILGRH